MLSLNSHDQRTAIRRLQGRKCDGARVKTFNGRAFCQQNRVGGHQKMVICHRAQAFCHARAPAQLRQMPGPHQHGASRPAHHNPVLW
jgi:hypothetical protein